MGRDRFERKPIRPQFDQPEDAPRFGLYNALVIDNEDPEGLGRVRLEVPSLGRFHSEWARLAVLMAGRERGTYFVPEVGDEVIVAFEVGDVNHPYVLGVLWSQENPPPERSTGGNNVKVIRTRSGIQIRLDDSPGDERVVVETPAGQRLAFEDFESKITIEDNNGNSIVLEPSGITINASAKVNVNASTVEVSTGMLNVNAGMSRFSGVVQANTVITNSVVSASYTPGAGNIW